MRAMYFDSAVFRRTGEESRDSACSCRPDIARYYADNLVQSEQLKNQYFKRIEQEFQWTLRRFFYFQTVGTWTIHSSTKVD